ncbi:MAG TPA: TonB-dependent receptor, partial [Terracidiphilus sp.]|nr:TonB-dependent receptor [Terracidiphilus sp.]
MMISSYVPPTLDVCSSMHAGRFSRRANHPALPRLLALVLVVGCLAVPAKSLRAQAAPATDAQAASTQAAPWSGQLHAASGAPIAMATIELTARGVTVRAVTGSDGSFRFPHLAPGSYRLRVKAQGRTVTLSAPVEINAGSPGGSLTLSPRGELTLAALTGQGASGGEQLSAQAVSSLPLNKRDFSSLLLLAAGTMTDSNGATNFTQQFAINGQRGVEATFARDGADISDPEMGGSTFSNFNVDAVESIESSSGVMPAQVGHGASGYTNIVTRSGASGFHGSFFEFVRNSAFDARNYFDHPTPAYPGRIPPFRRNEFGFTNGGPVFIPHLYDGRSRTFYFTEYQGFRQVLGTTQVMPVPTADERAGLDTLTFSDGSTDTLMVPVDPGIAAILARYPLPNNPTGTYGNRTYATASKVATDADQFSLRIDHKFSSKDQFFARFTMDNITGPTVNPSQSAIDPAFGIHYLDRQRNVAGTWTRTFTPKLVLQSLLSITRSTPGFSTTDYTDPGVHFSDGLFEAFNAAAGSLEQAYGNLFQGRESLTFTSGKHTFQAGFEARLNRDSTYFGVSPNGEYDFGGGTAYATEAIPSASGTHNIAVGDPLPDTLSGFLSGSAFLYVVELPAPGISGGSHIGPAAINRENYAAWLQDTWKVTPRLTLDLGLRWDLYTPISERAGRTGALRFINGVQQYVVNPQPGYQTSKHGFEPRVQAAWQATHNLRVNAGVGVMVIPPNLWQDNFLTGSTPFTIVPRQVAAPGAPIPYGFQITSAQLPNVYTPTGQLILDPSHFKPVAPNTIMDVNRYEQDMAALTHSSVISALNLSSVDASFTNATLFTWNLGLERKLGNLTADAAYVGTVAQRLPRYSYPNAFPGAGPGFAPYTTFDANGNVSGGFGVENVIVSDAHSTYHALQASLSGTVGHGGPGLQASFTWSKSIDDTSFVLGGTGSTGAVVTGISQNPFDTHPEKGPSAFDITRGFGLSVAQDLHL